jgi:hypothetical protein
MNHVMLDLETLGTTADAVVLSIGAVRFDPSSDRLGDRPEDKFYGSVSIDSQLQLGRRIQEDTLLWWIQQSPEARQVFFEPKKTLEAVLLDLADWISVIPEANLEVWAKPAKFDIAILEHAYQQHDIDVPWPHWASNCLTSFKKRMCEICVDVPKQPAPEIAHNALHDAIAQARYVQALTSLRNTRLNTVAA